MAVSIRAVQLEARHCKGSGTVETMEQYNLASLLRSLVYYGTITYYKRPPFRR
jgi:hypothetical protein